MPPVVVLTVGHSNHPLERFLALLARHGAEALADIRRFPGSRKHPHFHRDNLAAALQKSGVEYHWLEALGGRRPKRRDESPNRGLENQGFRNYADYMLTDEFREGMEKLLEVARRKRTAIMCAEGLFWQCHRVDADRLRDGAERQALAKPRSHQVARGQQPAGWLAVRDAGRPARALGQELQRQPLDRQRREFVRVSEFVVKARGQQTGRAPGEMNGTVQAR